MRHVTERASFGENTVLAPSGEERTLAVGGSRTAHQVEREGELRYTPTPTGFG